jgi:hypothetical protein
MKKSNRKQYLQTWLNYLKGKTEINYKELGKLLEKKFKDQYSDLTLKRYSITLKGNLLENGYISGKKGKGVKAESFPIVKTITLPVLDKCLSRDTKKVHFEEKDLTPVVKKQASLLPKKAQKKRATAPKKKIKAASIRQKAPKGKKVNLPALRVSKGEQSESEQTAFYVAQQLAEHIGELESRVAAYERIFENLRGLFNMEILDMEEWMEENF